MTKSTRAAGSRARSVDRAERMDLGAAARAGTLLPATLSSRARVSIPEGAPRLEQIRRVGCQLLYQYGYSGMTMRQIAAHLKIKAASLYYHFPSKQDILFDLMYNTAMALMEGLLRIADPDKAAGAQDPREQLNAAIRWHVLYHTQKREEAFVSHSELRSLTPENLEAVLRVRRDYDTVFTHILQRCQDEGVIPKRDLTVVRNGILTMCTATAGWFNPEGKLSADEVADQIIEFIWGGLLACGSEAAARASRPCQETDEMGDWHREALRDHPVEVPEAKPDPILVALREELERRKSAHLRQIQKPKSPQPE